ncbi:receptor protein-tyrosine kinase [Caerostris extrusa]|uniref:Receptor protein-tyrosine kinase n=1 Tax=Caerostris extrusa TaxID=172846 RepID=A0AAV4UH45_CAEEX|nr:receptor protein-tyrosine kinase [Caerostris extrusa]
MSRAQCELNLPDLGFGGARRRDVTTAGRSARSYQPQPRPLSDKCAIEGGARGLCNSVVYISHYPLGSVFVIQECLGGCSVISNNALPVDMLLQWNCSSEVTAPRNIICAGAVVDSVGSAQKVKKVVHTDIWFTGNSNSRRGLIKIFTIFDGRDACGADEWKIDDVDANDEDDSIITLLPHLKPFTTYAAYMRTYTIASALVGAQSPIIYFTTKPSTPSSPVNVQAHASSHNEIIIAWHGPKHPNGIITHYVIDGIPRKGFIRIHYFGDVRFKKPNQEKNTEVNDLWTFEEKKKNKEGESKNCCSCSKTKSVLSQGDDPEAQIQFEDFLQ